MSGWILTFIFEALLLETFLVLTIDLCICISCAINDGYALGYHDLILGCMCLPIFGVLMLHPPLLREKFACQWTFKARLELTFLLLFLPIGSRVNFLWTFDPSLAPDDDDRYGIVQVSGFYGPGNWLAWILMRVCASLNNLYVKQNEMHTSRFGIDLSDIGAYGYPAAAAVDLLYRIKETTLDMPAHDVASILAPLCVLRVSNLINFWSFLRAAPRLRSNSTFLSIKYPCVGTILLSLTTEAAVALKLREADNFMSAKSLWILIPPSQAKFADLDQIVAIILGGFAPLVYTTINLCRRRTGQSPLPFSWKFWQSLTQKDSDIELEAGSHAYEGTLDTADEVDIADHGLPLHEARTSSESEGSERSLMSLAFTQQADSNSAVDSGV